MTPQTPVAGHGAWTCSSADTGPPTAQGVGSGCVSPNGVVCWEVTEEAASATTVVHLLADRADLIEAVTDLRWLEWGNAPEPIDRDWWHAPRFAKRAAAGFP
jgi:hypothetical protein